MTESREERRAARTKKYVVARVRDIPEGSRAIVNVGGREIGIFNIDGRFHAILNRCPHRGGQLCKGDVLGLVESAEPGDVRLDASKKFISCPWHGWEFDIETGESWYNPERNTDPGRYPAARAFAIEIERGDRLDEQIAADTTRFEDRPATFIDPATHRVKGPYQAEILPVAVEDEYIVLSFRRT